MMNQINPRATRNLVKTLANLAIALSAVGVSSYASAQQLDCSQFRRNANGSWSPVAPMQLSNGNGMSIQIGPGVQFSPGVSFMGVDLASALNQQCR